MSTKHYIAIDLKSFYASVECRERGLDPLNTNLVVADVSRTEKTICLAVSPSLKAYGIPGRARLFEVVREVRKINQERRKQAGGVFSGKSYFAEELKKNSSLELDYIAAVPRMQLYMDYSTRIYQIYLKYIAPEDMHAYSVDEVFIDASSYLKTYGMDASEFCRMLIREVMKETGITATGGIGTNLYLAKVAMDILAKHMEPDEYGTRIASLDETEYRYYLWTHRPLKDFWRIGKGYTGRLEQKGMFTMGDIARCSLEDEEVLYGMFGVNAQHLINHAWGFDDTTMEAIHRYKPKNSSLSSGQVLSRPYPKDQARIVIREMAEQMAQNLMMKKLVTDQIVLEIGYDRESLSNPDKPYTGKVTEDWYGRLVPEHAHGSIRLEVFTSDAARILEKTSSLYDQIVGEDLLIRRMYVIADHVKSLDEIESTPVFEQMELILDPVAEEEKKRRELELEKERRAQEAVAKIRMRYGNNAVLRGADLQEGATAIERNRQIGGHKA